jgi:hypothetical protein
MEILLLYGEEHHRDAVFTLFFFLELKAKPANGVHMYKTRGRLLPTGRAYVQ